MSIKNLIGSTLAVNGIQNSKICRAEKPAPGLLLEDMGRGVLEELNFILASFF